MYLLHSYPDRFVIDVDGMVAASSLGGDATLRPVSGNGVPDSLTIDRASGKMMRTKGTVGGTMGGTPKGAYSERIDGILGTISLLRGRYLIVMTGSKHVATVQGCPIRQLCDTRLIPYQTDARSTPALTPQQQEDETTYLSLLNTVLTCGYFYFSYDYDLTLSTQRIADLRTAQNTTGAPQLPLWKRADSRFFWNRYVSEELIQAEAHEFIIPLMNGYIYQQHQRIKSYDLTFVLISRREHLRTGRRFILRGLDQQGNAANFAEAEQIIFVTSSEGDAAQSNSTNVASFLQTRGSIPLLWEQPITLKYAPKIAFQLNGLAPKSAAEVKKFETDTQTACRLHFTNQIAQYGKQVCLNLINQKGAELALVKAFKQNVDLLARQDVRLINWDFHQECRKMKYENISKLCELVKDDVDTMKYFSARVYTKTVPASNGASASASSSSAKPRSPNPAGGNNVVATTTRVEWEILTRQSGVIRTNCIDCLDRTNVVQSVFARRILDQQLYLLTGYNASIDSNESLDIMFRNVWANNADAMSIQYSGTGALKTDYTRTGKRTTRGAIQDGVNSLTRYYLNNFRDGTNQDSVDLFLGLYKPSLQSPSPYATVRGNKSHPAHQKNLGQFLLSFTLALALLCVTFTLLAPPILTPHRNWSYTTQAAAFGTVAALSGWKLIGRYGKGYTNRPILRAAAAAMGKGKDL